MLKLIIKEEKQGLVCGYWVKTKNTGCGLRRDYVNHSRKKEGNMNLEKIYVCMCLYLENRNKLTGISKIKTVMTGCSYGGRYATGGVEGV